MSHAEALLSGNMWKVVPHGNLHVGGAMLANDSYGVMTDGLAAYKRRKISYRAQCTDKLYCSTNFERCTIRTMK